MFGNFGGLYAQFFGANTYGIPVMPVLHIGDQTAMSGMGHSQGLDFDKQVVATILATEEFRDQISNFVEPLTKSLLYVIIPSIAENFAAQGRPRPWEPLSSDTVRIRMAARPILIRTGALFAAITDPNNWTVTQSDVWVSNTAAIPQYGEYHQMGTRVMPKREFVLFQEEDYQGIEQVFGMWIEENVRGWAAGGDFFI